MSQSAAPPIPIAIKGDPWQPASRSRARGWTRQALVGLPLLLLLGFLEPLLCVLHCTVWDADLAAAPAAPPVSQPTHLHHTHAEIPASGTIAADTGPGALLGLPIVVCVMTASAGMPGEGIPAPFPPPFHELIIPAALLLAGIGAGRQLQAAPRSPPPEWFPAPPHRPPITAV